MDARDILRTLAPTAAALLGGPFAGMAVQAIGKALDIDAPTQAKLEQALTAGQLGGDQLLQLKLAEQNLALELEKLGVKREELAVDDRKSARAASVAGGTHRMLFVLSLLLLGASLGAEIFVLFNGYPAQVPEIIVGRVLGLLDAVAMLVLSYWYGTTSGSAQKTDLLAQAAPIK